MSDVCVVTGGGSGMGLSAALQMPKDKIIIVSGRTISKLEKAVEQLKEGGHEAYACTCDTSDRESVKKLVEFAASKGTVRNVINAAGMSPNMAKPEPLLRVNALGTVYINQEFSKVMPRGSVIVDISSNSAYALPKILLNKKTFALAETDEAKFIAKCIKTSNLAKTDYQKSGFFDVTVHGARMFNSIEDVVKTRPRGGGGTDYEAVFRFINRTSGNTTPTSIVIITDGEGMFPDPSMVNNVPVLWLMTKNNKAPWGKSIVVK